MIPILFNAAPALLLTADPNWKKAVACEFSLLTDLSASVNQREERRALSATLRLKMTWESALDRDACNRLRAGLRALVGEDAQGSALKPILCPFWPAVRSYYDDTPAPFTAANNLIFEPDFSNYAIFTDYPYGYAPTSETLTAPLLVGRLDKLPVLTGNTDEDATASLSFLETGPASAALVPSALQPFSLSVLSHHGHDIEILPYAAGVRSPRSTVEVTVTRARVGYGRDEITDAFPQTPRRTLTATLDLGEHALAAALALFLRCRGSVTPFWTPAAYSPCRLVADAPAGALTLTVDNTAALDAHTHLWLADTVCDGGGQPVTTPGILPGGILQLAAPLAAPIRAETTAIQSLLLVRADKDTLKLSFTNPRAAELSIDLVELPPEYGSPAGETFAQNLGPLGATVWLYEFSDTAGQWRATSHESDVTWQGATYPARSLTHATITERINLEAADCELQGELWEGSPMARYYTQTHPDPLHLTITRVDFPQYASGATAVEVAFTGTISTCSYIGRKWKARFAGFTTLLERHVPSWMFQKTCSVPFCSAPCGLRREQWTFRARLDSTSANALTLSNIRRLETPDILPPMTQFDAHLFTGATITFDNKPGMAWSISDSPATDTGILVLVPEYVPDGLVPGTLVTLTPICDGLYSTCHSRLNKDNFRGFPHIPASSPSFTLKEVPESTGKK
jgi:hypothetical protein